MFLGSNNELATLPNDWIFEKTIGSPNTPIFQSKSYYDYVVGGD